MLPSHVNLDDLRETIRENISQLSSRPSDSPGGFLEAMFIWANEWWRRNADRSFEGYEPFAFVHHATDVTTPDPDEWNEALLFRESYSIDIGGRLFLTTSSMLAVLSSTMQFVGIEGIAPAMAKFGFKTLPTLIVDPAHSEVHYCPEGIGGDRISLPLNGRKLTPVTVQNIDDALENFHREQTQYPEGCVHCFDDRKQRVLRRDAEAIIRDALYLQLLRDTFKTQYVAREEHLAVGRPDISIRDASDLTKAACVFELKVLRSKGTTRKLGSRPRRYDDKAMRLHAYIGVSQARKYKRATSAALAYLVCFDGRDTDTPQTDIEHLCQQHGILPRRYFMLTSTRDDLGP